MTFLGPASQVTREQLENLVANRVTERQDLEFKREVSTTAQSQLGPITKAAASMANTTGGQILVGGEEKGGVAVGLPGIPFDQTDALKRRLDQAHRANLDPVVAGIEMTAVRVGEALDVLILEVPQSLLGPHRDGNTGRFYRRTSSGAAEMTMIEIREAFLLGVQTRELLEKYRRERLSQIREGLLPRSVEDLRPYWAFHCIPLAALSQSVSVDPREVVGEKAGWFLPGPSSTFDQQMCFEGLLMVPGGRDPTVAGYTLAAGWRVRILPVNR